MWAPPCKIGGFSAQKLWFCCAKKHYQDQTGNYVQNAELLFPCWISGVYKRMQVSVWLSLPTLRSTSPSCCCHICMLCYGFKVTGCESLAITIQKACHLEVKPHFPLVLAFNALKFHEISTERWGFEFHVVAPATSMVEVAFEKRAGRWSVEVGGRKHC